jgi:hypothetical protein
MAYDCYLLQLLLLKSYFLFIKNAYKKSPLFCKTTLFSWTSHLTTLLVVLFFYLFVSTVTNYAYNMKVMHYFGLKKLSNGSILGDVDVYIRIILNSTVDK